MIFRSYLTLNEFSGKLKEIHHAFIFTVSNLIQLDTLERTDMYQRYEEVHLDLAEYYYQIYRQNINSKARDLNKDFYSYDYFISNSEFIGVIITSICPLMDGRVTFAKTNSQFATSEGVEVMVHICDQIQYHLIPEFEDLLLKSSLIFDYDKNVDQLTHFTRKILEQEVVEVRSETMKAVQAQPATPDFSTSLGGDVTVVVSIGFDTSEVEVVVDHNAKKVIVRSSDQPVVKKVLEKYVKVRNVDASTYCPPSKYGSSKTLNLDKGHFDLLKSNAQFSKAELES